VFYRFKPVIERPGARPYLLESHKCCQAAQVRRLSFLTTCIPYSGGYAYFIAYNMTVPTRCECRTCSF